MKYEGGSQIVLRAKGATAREYIVNGETIMCGIILDILRGE